MIDKKIRLNYFFATKKDVLIVSLVGPLSRENGAIFDECIREIKKAQAKWVLIHFRDVSELDKSLFPAMARLQKTVREKPCELKMCAIHPRVLEALMAQGLIRLQELYNNLAEALKSIAEMTVNTAPAEKPVEEIQFEVEVKKAA